MAKRIIDWEIKTDGNLVMREWLGGDDLGVEIARFDLNKIFPEYTKMNTVQRFLISYGVKQKLADAGASEKTADGKATVAKEKFQDFVDGKVQKVRAAGEAKENKQIANKVREALNSKVVSLESLILKKTLQPENFTEEDQVKLDEFLALKAQMEAKTNVKK